MTDHKKARPGVGTRANQGNAVADAGSSVTAPHARNSRPRFVCVNLAAVPAPRWGRVLRETAAIPGPLSLLLIVPAAAFVPGDLDELRHTHGPNVAVVSDDWLTADQWRAALREGVAPWLGMFA